MAIERPAWLKDKNCSIFKYQEENKKAWFARYGHAGYLGKELKKAEICLAIGTEYIQD